MKHRILWLLPFPMAVVVRMLAGTHADVVERVWARGAYPLLTAPFAWLSATVPFSLAEGWIAMALVVLVMLLRNKRFFALTVVLGLCAAWFVGGWGLLYDRVPLPETMGLAVAPASTDALIERIDKLAWEASVAACSARDDDIERAVDAVLRLSEDVPVPQWLTTPKVASLSRLLTPLLIEGVTFPFTQEALINGEIPPVSRPFIACHEVAHLAGYAREEDANLLAYLACRASPDADYRYSGAMMALRACLNALEGVDWGAYQDAWWRLPSAVRDGLSGHSAFWLPKRAEPAATVAAAVNGAYLSAISAGAQDLHSYGQWVDALLALSPTL